MRAIFVLVALVACNQIIGVRDPTPRPELTACCIEGRGEPEQILECVDRWVDENAHPDGSLECVRVQCGFTEIESTSCESL